VPVNGAPDVGLDLALDGLGLGAALLAVPALISIALEAGLLAATDRIDRRPLLAGALAVTALSSLIAAFSPNAAVLSLALGVWGTAGGVAEGAAQAALVARGNPERAMTRWGISASIGDLVAPLLLAALGDWRTALAFTALFPALDAVAVAIGPRLDRGIEEDDDAEPLRLALRDALRDRALLSWLLAATACTLMDEILIVFAALRMESLGLGAAERAGEITALCVGGLVGASACERWLDRIGATRILLLASATAAVAALGWLAVTGPWVGGMWMFALGAGIAPMYPLAKGRAYACRPDRPGLVGALDHVLATLDLVAPVIIGAIAAACGPGAAVAALLVQPAVVAVVAWRHRR
jgi:predicted MFS family arabinose efflux permease